MSDRGGRACFKATPVGRVQSTLRAEERAQVVDFSQLADMLLLRDL